MSLWSIYVRRIADGTQVAARGSLVAPFVPIAENKRARLSRRRFRAKLLSQVAAVVSGEISLANSSRRTVDLQASAIEGERAERNSISRRYGASLFHYEIRVVLWGRRARGERACSIDDLWILGVRGLSSTVSIGRAVAATLDIFISRNALAIRDSRNCRADLAASMPDDATCSVASSGCAGSCPARF